MKELWMVWDSEDGLVLVGNYEETNKKYESYKETIQQIALDGDLAEDDRVILAKIKKDFSAENNLQEEEY